MGSVVRSRPSMSKTALQLTAVYADVQSMCIAERESRAFREKPGAQDTCSCFICNNRFVDIIRGQSRRSRGRASKLITTHRSRSVVKTNVTTEWSKDVAYTTPTLPSVTSPQLVKFYMHFHQKRKFITLYYSCASLCPMQPTHRHYSD